ncbi:MAG: efflux RND transporter periplasmic adaptor subunit [Planctomycetota bacterium]
MTNASPRKTKHVIQLDQRESAESGKRRSHLLPVLLRVLLPVAALVSGWVGYSILSVEPEDVKRPEAEERTIKTRAVELYTQDFPTTIRTHGVIRAHNEVVLTPQVSGKIIRILPGFEDGAFFDENDILVEFDPQDFETAVIVAEAQHARAISTHAQEKTRANQARLNWEDLGYDEEPSDLVLRGPQLREAEANMKSAKAQLDQANRNLERTKVRAPFDGRVRRRTVGLGQSVGPGMPLGTVFAIEFAEVRLPITARDMAFLTLPEGPEDPPVEVQLRDALAQDETVWAAKIIRTEGTLDENSLELFAIARVSDPFGRQSPHPPLRIGQPVIATMPGSVLKDVLVVPRVAVRQLDQIILLDPNELTIESRRIETIWSDEECVIVRDPTIADGSLLATTHLVYAPDGSKVELLPDPNLPTQDMAGFESKDKAAGKEQL